MSLFAFLTWYLTVLLLGLAAQPLAAAWLPGLPDRGHSVAKLLGILLTGFLLWLTNAWGWLPNDARGALACAFALAALGLWLHRRRRSGHPVASEPPEMTSGPHLRLVVALELVFLAAFATMALVRFWSPAIDHTEQPMDLAMLSGVQSSRVFPPRDPWLAGYPIGYYYLGYWLVAMFGNLTGQPPEVAYNLGLACWFGLLVVGCFGLGANLRSLVVGEEKTGGRLLWGGLFALSVAFAANLTGIHDGIRALFARAGSGATWWWWRASRLFEDRDAFGEPVELIAEFPAFSYVLGDLHPHLLATPILLLTACASLHLMLPRRLGPGPVARASDRPRRRRRIAVGALPGGSWNWLLALLLAASLSVSTWDFPAHFALLLAGVHAAHRRSNAGAGAARPPALASGLVVLVGLTVAALLLLLPFLLTVQGMASGLLPNLFQATPLGRTLLHFGPFLPGIAILLVIAWRHEAPARGALVRNGLLLLGLLAAATLGGTGWALLSGPGQAWIAEAGWAGNPGSILGTVLERRLPGLPTLALWGSVAVLGLSLTPARPSGSNRSAAFSFALLVGALGAGIALVPELVFVEDLFGSRINTVFKLYYLAWPLLAMAGAFGLLVGLESGGRDGLRASRAVALSGICLIGLGLVYPTVAAWTRRGGPHRTGTLDGLAHLEVEAPDELAAIRWIRRHVPADAIVVQAVGRSYRPGDARVAAATGRATLLGWAGHEAQWRGEAYAAMAAGRPEAVTRLYRPASADELQADLEEWAVDFLYLGPAERVAYGVGEETRALLDRAMERVFHSGEVTLYGNRNRTGRDPEERSSSGRPGGRP